MCTSDGYDRQLTADNPSLCHSRLLAVVAYGYTAGVSDLRYPVS